MNSEKHSHLQWLLFSSWTCTLMISLGESTGQIAAQLWAIFFFQFKVQSWDEQAAELLV